MKGAWVFDIVYVSKYWLIYEEAIVILEWIEENCKKKNNSNFCSSEFLHSLFCNTSSRLLNVFSQIIVL